MSEYLQVLELCLEEAPDDPVAEALLRTIVQGAAKRAPIDALVELGHVLVAIRNRDLAQRLESN